MIDDETFFELESDIGWGCTDSSRQMRALNVLQSSPALATDEDEFGCTLLMVAANAANLEVTRALCLLGAHVNALASTGDTPLICAVRGALGESSAAASLHTRAAIIDTLIQHGADPDQRGWQGCSALHYAVIYGFTELVRRLLLGGADPQARLCDPPSDENAIELVESYRFQGSDQQRLEIRQLFTPA